MSDPWPWPMTPTGSVYCPVPAIEGFFAPFASRWTTPYPLVKIVWNRYPIPHHNDTTATLALTASLAAGTMGHIRASDVHVNAFLQNLESLSIAFGNNSSNATTTTTAAPPSLIWPGVINANFCAYGYTFILEAITGYLLSAIAMGCFIALVVRTSRHTNRKLLFFLLFTVGVTRGLFGHLAANRIGMVNSYYEMNNYIGWFFDWTIPLSMLGDLLMSYLDFLLTFFWLQFIAPRWSRSHWGTFVPVASVMLTLLISIVVFLTDWHQLHSDNDGNNDGGGNIEAASDRDDAYNGGNIYYRSLAYISSLLLVSSILHSIVVVKLLRDLITHQTALQELSPKMRQNMTAVGVIGFLSVLSGIMRGVVLLGHISRLSIFLDGQLSFDNPEFFTVYLIGFMNMPCLAICVAFFHLSWKLISSGEMDDDDCIGSDGAYSVVDDGDGVRISLIAGRYAYRMNSNNFGGGRQIGDSFASNGTGYGGGGPTTGADIDSISYPSESFNAGAGGTASATTSGNFGGNPSNLVADNGNGATPVRGSSSRGIATSAAMFAGTRGPGAGFIVSGNTPHGSRSRRELKCERAIPKANSVDETEENH